MRPPSARKGFALLAALFLLPGLLCAAPGQYLFRHFETEDGLSGNSVTCITQDQLGIIWVGTRNGVCWFDGERFHAPTITDTEGFLSSSISSICTEPDGRIWISTAKGLCSYHPGTGEFRTLAGPEGRVSDLHCDREGRLWLVISGEIWLLDPASLNFTRYSGQTDFYAYRGCLDSDGRMWFSSRDGYLHRFQDRTDSFERFQILSRSDLDKGIFPRIITPLDGGEFLIATSNNEVRLSHPTQGTSDILLTAKDLEDEAVILCMIESRNGEYLIGSNKGLYQLSVRTRTMTRICVDPLDRLSLSNDNIRSLFRDRSGQVWVGTFYSGIDLWQQSEITFYRNISALSPYSIQGNTVRAICRDETDNLWVGTEDGFINRIAPDGTVLPLGPEHELPQMANYHALAWDDGQLVIATYDNGVLFFDPVRLKVTRHAEIPGSHFICLLRTGDGYLLAGAGNGLYEYSPESGSFEHIKEFPSHFVHALCEDLQGRVWIGTYGAGPWIFEPSTRHFHRMEAAQGSTLPDNSYITHLYADPGGKIWMATEGDGLLCADEDNSAPGVFHTAQYTKQDGLPSNVICAIARSHDGALWISTDNGLFSFDPETDRLTGTYYDRANTVGNFYRYGATLVTPDGRIHMGTTLGMLSFRPSAFQSPKEPELLITDILGGHSDKLRSITEPGHSAMTSGKVRVKLRETSFLTFRFADIASDPWQRQHYHYRFRHRNHLIESTTQETSVTFAGIQPGRYDFEISVPGNASGTVSKRVSVRVIPPLYASWAARLFYLLVVAALVGWMTYNTFRRKKQEREQHLQTLEEQKQHEIFDAKINFFTNIAHEIRTPLTLIKMPVDKMIQEKLYNDRCREDLLTVQANTDRLLSLTNQLLDFRKIESKQLRLTFLQEDLCDLTRRTCSYFTRAAQENHIDFSIDIPNGKILVMCAAASIEKIINNLISNGLKYCTSKVSLSLEESPDGKGAILKVISDGEKIHSAAREKIFEPFYQERSSQIKILGSKGTGLGLPFARMLTELHNGRLYLEDSDSPGNTFVLILPKEQDQTFDLARPQPQAETETLPETTEGQDIYNRHTVLIAEDDVELNNYLKKELSADYIILQAFNGDEALETINRQKVDILISDIMMPGIDGCTLCNIVKTHLEHSHIPVLLLTAAVGMERHIETLQVGADGYLEKPFPIDLLKANIQNLFDNRELTFKQFTNSPLSHFNGLKVNNMDDEFMNRLHQEVMRRLADPDLGIDDLVSSLGTSKSTLFRKVKANTGLNIGEYIKLSRLKKAAELLASQKYKIGEVVYLVGFSSASYFTASFKKQFNVSPSEFIKQVKGERPDN